MRKQLGVFLGYVRVLTLRGLVRVISGASKATQPGEHTAQWYRNTWAYTFRPCIVWGSSMEKSLEGARFSMTNRRPSCTYFFVVQMANLAIPMALSCLTASSCSRPTSLPETSYQHNSVQLGPTRTQRGFRNSMHKFHAATPSFLARPQFCLRSAVCVAGASSKPHRSIWPCRSILSVALCEPPKGVA